MITKEGRREQRVDGLEGEKRVGRGEEGHESGGVCRCGRGGGVRGVGGVGGVREVGEVGGEWGVGRGRACGYVCEGRDGG